MRSMAFLLAGLGGLAACGGETVRSVVPPPPVASLLLAGPDSLLFGQTAALSATPQDASGNPLIGRPRPSGRWRALQQHLQRDLPHLRHDYHRRRRLLGQQRQRPARRCGLGERLLSRAGRGRTHLSPDRRRAAPQLRDCSGQHGLLLGRQPLWRAGQQQHRLFDGAGAGGGRLPDDSARAGDVLHLRAWRPITPPGVGATTIWATRARERPRPIRFPSPWPAGTASRRSAWAPAVTSAGSPARVRSTAGAAMPMASWGCTGEESSPLRSGWPAR